MYNYIKYKIMQIRIQWRIWNSFGKRGQAKPFSWMILKMPILTYKYLPPNLISGSNHCGLRKNLTNLGVNKFKIYIFVHLYTFSNFHAISQGGNYSALVFTIKLRRKLSYHLVQTYLPSVLLIFITWLCFLIPSNMVEARIGISLTTVLTLTAMFAAVL